MEIRRIRPEEAEAVVGLWDTLARETPDGGALTEGGKANLKRMLAAAASHPRQHCLVAVEGHEVIGFLVFKLTGDELLPGVAGELEEHFVLALHRRREIGRRLVESAGQVEHFSLPDRGAVLGARRQTTVVLGSNSTPT